VIAAHITEADAGGGRAGKGKGSAGFVGDGDADGLAVPCLGDETDEVFRDDRIRVGIFPDERPDGVSGGGRRGLVEKLFRLVNVSAVGELGIVVGVFGGCRAFLFVGDNAAALAGTNEVGTVGEVVGVLDRLVKLVVFRVVVEVAQARRGRAASVLDLKVRRDAGREAGHKLHGDQVQRAASIAGAVIADLDGLAAGDELRGFRPIDKGGDLEFEFAVGAKHASGAGVGSRGRDDD